MIYKMPKVIKYLRTYTEQKYYIKSLTFLIEDMSVYFKMEHLIKSAPGKGLFSPRKLTPVFDDPGETEIFSLTGMGSPTGFTTELTNPSKTLLKVLGRHLRDIPYRLVRLNVACDINTPSRNEAIDLLYAYRNNMVIPMNSNIPVFGEGSSGRYELSYLGSTPDKCEFDMIVPQPGENTNGQMFLHTEFSLIRPDVIRKEGFQVFDDLVSLNLAHWYKSHVLICAVAKHRIGEIYSRDTNQPAPNAKECHKIFRHEFGTLAPLHRLYHEGVKYRSALRDHRLIDWNIEEEWC